MNKCPILSSYNKSNQNRFNWFLSDKGLPRVSLRANALAGEPTDSVPSLLEVAALAKMRQILSVIPTRFKLGQ